jgi:hypothetical protein
MGLVSIVLPKSLTKIGNAAFKSCNGLCSADGIVYYGGTAEEWKAFGTKIGIDNTFLTSAPRYYYSVTQPTTSGNYWHYVNDVPTKW